MEIGQVNLYKPQVPLVTVTRRKCTTEVKCLAECLAHRKPSMNARLSHYN